MRVGRGVFGDERKGHGQLSGRDPGFGWRVEEKVTQFTRSKAVTIDDAAHVHHLVVPFGLEGVFLDNQTI